MTIYMITREHETETGNGSIYDDYVDEEFGYFVDRGPAEEKLRELQLAEAESHKRQWEERTHKPWLKRKAERERVLENNRILMMGGVPSDRMDPVPQLWAEPVYPGWKTGMTDYNIITVEPALASTSSAEGEDR